MRKPWVFTLFLGLAFLFGSAMPVLAARNQQAPDNKPEKKKKKKDSDESSSDAKDRRALHELLQDVQDGMEGHSPTRVMHALDEQFYDYPRFEDQITQFIQQNSEIRMYFREASTEVKGDKATVTVDGEMVYSTKAAPQKEIQRRQTVEFFFQRLEKGGWKIYDINPRGFFTF